MNKYDKTIVKYLDERLSIDERIEFEHELEINTELMNAFQNYKKVNELFSTSNELNVDQDYFNEIVPRFRQNIEKEKYTSHFRNIGYAFATILIMISSYLLFQDNFFNQNLEYSSVQSITDNLSQEDMNELVNYVSDKPWEDFSDEENYTVLNNDYFTLEGIVSNASEEDALVIFSDYQINDIYSIAANDEIEKVYNEILTREIF